MRSASSGWRNGSSASAGRPAGRMGHRTGSGPAHRRATARRPPGVPAGPDRGRDRIRARIPTREHDVTLALNPQQDAAVRHPGGPLLVLAGAGSGKTRVLTARIAHLIRERGVAPSRVFAVTFTNRAAGGMRAPAGPALRQANAMDFDDLLLFPLTLFAERPERLAYWQRRFDHVLVDEFQDTNAAQYRLVKRLASEHRNLCVVGDDDQAIYGWRGADVRHMLSFQQDFPGATLIKLEQNYRSTQVILDAANGVIAENARRLGKTLFTVTQGGEPVTLLTAADERDEAEWLAGELGRAAADGAGASQGVAGPFRTNSARRPL